ncbi:CotH kinase family protein [Paenibacillus athensensis]|uniref:Spore coat protein H n=2 Tax=Paenibacillus athensensis TaxID=1967502 RepID=A0A4Y8Q0I7_9BACL|nr:CotH kinase family protein [Paenibacillus athensensis]
MERSEAERLSSSGRRSQDQFVKATLTAGAIKQHIVMGYRGGHTRYYPKKSYEIRIGNRTIHYNAEYDDPSMLRNALSFQFFEKLGVPSPRTRHVRLVLNGVPLGLYVEIEGVDRSFFSKRRVQARSLLYAVSNKANFRLYDNDGEAKRMLSSGYEVVIGTSKELTQIARFVRSVHTLKQSALLAYLKSHLNIPQYLRWLAGAVCTGNYDGFDQNYALYRTAGSLRYHISPWDYEGTWGRNCYGELDGSDIVRITGYNGLTEKLLAFPVIRREYRRVLTHTLNHSFTLRELEPLISRLHAALLPELSADETRKHSPFVVAGDKEVFLRYIRERRAYLLEKLTTL